MQDEHFMKLRSEAQQGFFASLEQHRGHRDSIGQAYESARVSAPLLAIRRERLAKLLSWAIPGGFLAGTVAAAIAAAATMPPAPRLAAAYHPIIASFTLPYPA
jgi:hypothetical protein